MEAGAKHAVDDDVGLFKQAFHRLARRCHHRFDAHGQRALRHHAGKVALDLAGLDGGHHRSVDALAQQLLGGHPAVTAVVAKAGEDRHVLDLAHVEGFVGRGRAGAVHQL